ncbi:unnamed protein product [Closterium sp. Naga37s-1]|nr:unnamed protein product [Closterium sp. Naga37s-1]
MEAHRSNNTPLRTDISTGASARSASASAASASASAGVERGEAATPTALAVLAASQGVAAVSAAAVAAVRISTFHSFCLQTLRQFAHLAGLPKDFTVFPPMMQLHFIIRRFLHEFGRLEAENAAMQVLQGSRNLHQPAAAATTAASARAPDPSATAGGAVNHGAVHRRRRISFGGDCGGGGGEGEEDGGLFAWLWEQYRRRLMLNKAVDFSQFAPKAVKLLHAHPEILASSSTCSREHAPSRARTAAAAASPRNHLRVSHVLVDEFQDTDSCQMELLLLLCRPLPSAPTLTLVADDDQQIYSFRGAMGLPNLRRFLRTYPQARTVCLDQNFRSCGSVVEAARHVIAHNQWRHAKWMVTEAPVGPLVSLCECRTDRCEAAAVVGKICHLVGSCGVPANQIAILYRVQAVGKVIWQYLKSHGIKVSSAATGGGGAGGFGGGGGGGGGGAAGGGEWGAAEEDGVAVAANGFIAEGGNSATAGGARGGRGTGTVGAVFHDILALLRLAANESDDMACRQVLRFVCPPPTRQVAVCLRTLQCAPHRISLLPAARMTRLHLLGISRCAALSNVSSTNPGSACNGSAGNSSAFNGSHITHAHNAAGPAWPHTLSPDDTEVLEGIKRMAAAVSELQGLLGIPPPGWSSPPAPASSAPASASRPPASSRRRGSGAGIMGLGGGTTSLSAIFHGEGGGEEEEDGVSCEALDNGGVVLSTIHQAKGLEWQAVIVVRANEGVLPLVDFSRVTQAPATAATTNYSPTPQTLQPTTATTTAEAAAAAAAAQGGSSRPGAYTAGGAVAGREGCGRECGLRPLPLLPAMPPDYDAHLEEEVS